MKIAKKFTKIVASAVISALILVGTGVGSGNVNFFKDNNGIDEVYAEENYYDRGCKHESYSTTCVREATCLLNAVYKYTCNDCGQICNEDDIKGGELYYSKLPHIDNNNDCHCDICGTEFIIELNENNFPDKKFRESIGKQYDSDGDGWINSDDVVGIIDLKADKSIIGLDKIENVNADKISITLNDFSSDLFSDLGNYNFKYLYINGTMSTEEKELLLPNMWNLEYIDVSCTNLYKLDISKLVGIKYLYCEDNLELESLTIGNKDFLHTIRCRNLNFKINELDIDGCPNLELLQAECFCKPSHGKDDEIQTIDLSSCKKLRNVELDGNGINKLDVSENPELKSLRLSYNNLTELDLSNNLNLWELYIENNKLTKLILPNSLEFESLSVKNNILSELDLSRCKNLSWLNMEHNMFKKIDLSKNQKLTHLSCGCNLISDLDLRENTQIQYLSDCPLYDFCTNDNLHNLNRVLLSKDCNVFNDDIFGRGIYINAETNLVFELEGPELMTATLYQGGTKLSWTEVNEADSYCIYRSEDGKTFNRIATVDGKDNLSYIDKNIIANKKYSYKVCAKRKCSIDEKYSEESLDSNVLTFSLYSETKGMIEISQDNFHDENLRIYLQNKFDSDNDGWINRDEVTSIFLDGCTSLKGIHFFNNLKTLGVFHCSSTDGLEKVRNLEELWIEHSDIRILDVSNLKKLKTLRCDQNENLEKLILGNNESLERLEFGMTKLREVDVTGCPNLIEIRNGMNYSYCNISGNIPTEKISTMDISKCKKLEILELSYCELDNIDLSNNPELWLVNLSGNNLTEIDLSNNVKIEDIDVGYNNLKNIDLSKNINLEYVFCENNPLTELDLRNNKNVCHTVSTNTNIEKILLSKDNSIFAIGADKNTYVVIDYPGPKLNSVSGYAGDTLISWSDIGANGYAIYRSEDGINYKKIAELLGQGVTSYKDKTTVESKTYSYKVCALKNSNIRLSSDRHGYEELDIIGQMTECSFDSNIISYTAVSKSGFPSVNVTYHTHIQSYGDSQGTKTNGQMAGTSGEAKRLENIWLKVDGNPNLGIQYTTHCQSYGWMSWSANGEANGTSGEAKRLEAIKIQLTGADANKYDVYYRVHAQSYGWLAWAKNGEPSGTAGYGKRLEGIQVVVLKKGEAAPGLNYAGVNAASTAHDSRAYIEKTASTITIPGSATAPNVMYKTHVQSYGWQKWVYNGAMSGTSGEAKRLEGIDIKLTNCDYAGGITYRTHVQSYGWMNWAKDGVMSGTSGEAKRLEAIDIKLYGEMEKQYDVYYRVHAQSYGWLSWAKNGESAGTAGYGKRLEGIQIVLVPKNGAAPGKTYGGITSINDKAYIAR